MAKDLPYFKFIISEWNDGDVTLCSLEAQGLFINLCSLYWSQEGELSLSKCKRRFSGCNAVAWKQLVGDGVIKIQEDNIVINFLDEQLEDRGKLSDTNATNAAKGWEKRRLNATALRRTSDRIEVACNIEEKRREEKRREEKREEEKRREDPLRAVAPLPFESKDFHAAWLEWMKFRKEKRVSLPESTVKKQFAFLSARDEVEAIAIINQSITNGWTGLFEIRNNGQKRKTAGENLDNL